MPKHITCDENTGTIDPLPNLIVFPGGGRKTEAENLPDRFCDVCLIFDREEQIRQFQLLRNKIFSHVSGRSYGVNSHD